MFKRSESMEKAAVVGGVILLLCLFLLEMGIVAARRLKDLREVGVFLVGFGIFVPILHGLLAVWLGGLAGLSMSGSAVLGAMVSSASYIAAPAAVRIALPEANPTFYLTASLGITSKANWKPHFQSRNHATGDKTRRQAVSWATVPRKMNHTSMAKHVAMAAV